MIGLICHWSNPVAVQESPPAEKKITFYWICTAKALGVDRLVFVAPAERPTVADEEIEAHIVQTIDEALALFPDCDRVWVNKGGEDIKTFKHPESAVYIVGPDYGSLNPPEGETVVGIDSKIVLHAAVAAGIVLSWRSP